MQLNNASEIISFIRDSKKVTPVKVYINGDFNNISTEGVRAFGQGDSRVIFGDWSLIEEFLATNSSFIHDYEVEYDRRNSAIPMLDTRKIEARIEPGAIIRDMVTIGKNAVIMMGASINIGSVIGENTMIDMNVVMGGRATVGRNCHIGAGTVLAGVIEPPSATPVIVEDNVVIGANAVVLEGVRVGRGAVVAAGSIVTKDVRPGVVVAGSPAREVKSVDDGTREKTQLVDDLRGN